MNGNHVADSHSILWVLKSTIYGTGCVGIILWGGAVPTVKFHLVHLCVHMYGMYSVILCAVSCPWTPDTSTVNTC